MDTFSLTLGNRHENARSMIGLLAAVVVVGGALVCTPAVAAPTEYKTRISFRDFKAAYDIAKIARLFDPRRVRAGSRLLDQEIRPVWATAEDEVHTMFRTRTPPVHGPSLTCSRVKPAVQVWRFEQVRQTVVTFPGGVYGGIRSVRCGGGPAVSATWARLCLLGRLVQTRGIVPTAYRDGSRLALFVCGPVDLGGSSSHRFDRASCRVRPPWHSSRRTMRRRARAPCARFPLRKPRWTFGRSSPPSQRGLIALSMVEAGAAEADDQDALLKVAEFHLGRAWPWRRAGAGLDDAGRRSLAAGNTTGRPRR